MKGASSARFRGTMRGAPATLFRGTMRGARSASPPSAGSTAPSYTTLTFLNCQGSASSRSSGNSFPRSVSGVQSVYLPTTGPR